MNSLALSCFGIFYLAEQLYAFLFTDYSLESSENASLHTSKLADKTSRKNCKNLKYSIVE